MERYSRVLLVFSGLILILIGVPRLLLSTWLPLSQYAFYLAVLIFIVGMALNYRTIGSFFTMRTTKYGLNMGTLMVLGFLLYICVNFMAFRYDRSVDITSDKLNSLSLQSLEVLDNLKEDVTFKVYFQGAAHKSQNMGLRMIFKKYKRESPKIKTSFIDAHKDPQASNVLSRTDRGKLVVFVSKGDKLERVKEPVSEESITSALFRLVQTEVKKVYFLTGHGERSISKSGEPGDDAVFLREAIEEQGFQVDTINISDRGRLPNDISLLIVLGPKKDLLENEAGVIQDYLLEGGALLMALDPENTVVTYGNIASAVGINVDKNTLLSTQTLAGGDSLSILGRDFNKLHPITKVLDKNAITLFYESGSMSKVTATKFKVTPLVSTLPVVIPVENLQNYQVEIQGKEPESKTIALVSEGNLDGGDHSGHDHGDGEIKFKVGVFADSDFTSDVYFETGFNKDLALNAVAYLAGGQDQLISIRPRVAKNTKLILTAANSAFVLIMPVLIPLVLLIFAVVLWFRRRGA